MNNKIICILIIFLLILIMTIDAFAIDKKKLKEEIINELKNESVLFDKLKENIKLSCNVEINYQYIDHRDRDNN